MKPLTMEYLMDDVPAGEAVKAVNEGRVAGDCLRACVASIMEMPADQVPHFAQYREPADEHLWWWALLGWCAAIGVQVELFQPPSSPSGWSIADGKSKRGHSHVCVAYNGRVVHDPHPSRSGLTTIEAYFAFYPVSQGAEEVLGHSPADRVFAPLVREEGG